MDSTPTLQDFILNLIYDPAARSAFELDPHSTLDAAGLGDVTAADVQDVLPLVLDYAPLSNTTALTGLAPVDDLTTGVAHLDVAGAVAHLQAITAQVGGIPSHAVGDLNIAAAGAITVTADHLVSGVVTAGVPGLLDTSTNLIGQTDVGVTAVNTVHSVTAGVDVGGLDGAYDPAVNLDTAVSATVGQTSADVAYTSESIIAGTGIGGTLDATVNTLTGVTGSLGVGIDDLDVSGVQGATSSVVGSVTGGLLPDGNVVESTTSVVDHTVSGVTGLVTGSSAAEPAQENDHGLLGGLTGGLHF